MRKLLFTLVFAISILGADSKDIKTKELLECSYLSINDSISLYAARVNMKNFEDDDSYSVGIVLNQDSKDDAEFGIGYMKSSEDIDSLWDPSVVKTDRDNGDGVLFFVNYKF